MRYQIAHHKIVNALLLINVVVTAMQAIGVAALGLPVTAVAWIALLQLVISGWLTLFQPAGVVARMAGKAD